MLAAKPAAILLSSTIGSYLCVKMEEASEKQIQNTKRTQIFYSDPTTYALIYIVYDAINGLSWSLPEREMIYVIITVASEP